MASQFHQLSGTLWPARTHTLPEHAAYPQRLNSTEELIDRHVEAGRGDRVALLYEDQRLTYRQLQAAVSRLGSALRALGIEEEDRVLLRAPSIPPALVANFAVLRIGGVIVPTSPLLSRAELVTTWSGLRPGTPDRAPFIGPVPEHEGLIAATGHFRSGLILAPITAKIVRELVTTGRSSHDLSRFAPGREFKKDRRPEMLDESACA